MQGTDLSFMALKNVAPQCKIKDLTALTILGALSVTYVLNLAIFILTLLRLIGLPWWSNGKDSWTFTAQAQGSVPVGYQIPPAMVWENKQTNKKHLPQNIIKPQNKVVWHGHHVLRGFSITSKFSLTPPNDRAN